MNPQFKATLPMAELLIIKQDFDLLRKMVPQLKSEIVLPLVPYISLFCYEALIYLHKKGIRVDIIQTGKYSMKDIRHKAKFFDLGFSRLLNRIETIDRIQSNCTFEAYPHLGPWNVYPNLSLTFDKEAAWLSL